MPLGDCNQLVHVPLSQAERLRCGEQSTTDGEGLPPIFLAEIPVTAAHCETVRIPNGRHGHDLDRQIQIDGHPTHDRTLLKILLPEERDVRLRHIEQLAYNRRAPTKMSRSESAAKRFRELARFDE